MVVWKVEVRGVPEITIYTTLPGIRWWQYGFAVCTDEAKFGPTSLRASGWEAVDGHWAGENALAYWHKEQPVACEVAKRVLEIWSSGQHSTSTA